MTLTDKQTRDRVRKLNEAFRKSLDPNLDKLMMASGVTALPSDVRAMAIRETPSA
jgi:hypothetical protein